MEQQVAKLNYLRMAPRKVRSVGDLIKGLSVNEAEAQLLVQRRRPAKAILKLLRSAVSNAKTNKRWNAEHLFVASVRVDGGPMLHRMLPRARGSASEIQKKMSHVTIVLGLNENLKSKFTIVPPAKKERRPRAEEKPAREKHEKTEETPAVDRNRKEGFFKRVFSPKSRASK